MKLVEFANKLTQIINDRGADQAESLNVAMADRYGNTYDIMDLFMRGDPFEAVEEGKGPNTIYVIQKNDDYFSGTDSYRSDREAIRQKFEYV